MAEAKNCCNEAKKSCKEFEKMSCKGPFSSFCGGGPGFGHGPWAGGPPHGYRGGMGPVAPGPCIPPPPPCGFGPWGFGRRGCHQGPPPHVIARFMKMWGAKQEDQPLSDDGEDGNQVQKAEKPDCPEGEGHGRLWGPKHCWKKWFGKEPEVWFKVVHLPELHKNASKVHVEELKLVVEEVKESETSSSEEETSPSVSQSVDLPKRLILRTLRTSWLGPHRLMMFGLKKPKETPAEEEAEEKNPGCWFKFIPLPGFHGGQISAKIKDGKVKIRAIKMTTNEESGDFDRMESTRVVELPDNIRTKTLRLARMGPMRLCLFALKKKDKKAPEEEVVLEEQEVEKVAEEMEKVQMHESSDGSSDEEDWIKAPVEDFNMEVDVQGFAPEDITVKMKKGTIHVSALQMDESGENRLERRINLPADIDLDTLKCTVNAEEGLLKISGRHQFKSKEEPERALKIEI